MFDFTHATATHPRLVEQFHRWLKDTLHGRAAAIYWYDHLPWVMLGICAAFLEYSDFPPAEAVFCSQLVLPSQYVDDTTEFPLLSFLQELQNTTVGHSLPPVPHNFHWLLQLCQRDCCWPILLLVHRDALASLYNGPFRILERSTYFFLLQIGDQTDKVSTFTLKLAQTSADTGSAKQLRMGHPAVQAPPSRPAQAVPTPRHCVEPQWKGSFQLPPAEATHKTSTPASWGCTHSSQLPNRLNL
jgi:hypothetical protein